MHNQNVRMSICCEDCKDNHKCGIICRSQCCMDDACGCTATKLRPGLYQCNVCKLLVCCKDDSFFRYVEEIMLWYDAFLAENEVYLTYLQKKALSKNALTEQERQIYEVVNTFHNAKCEFSAHTLGAIKLNTISHRKSAYILVEAFEKIKKVTIPG